jgi:hypothetical protein
MIRKESRIDPEVSKLLREARSLITASRLHDGRPGSGARRILSEVPVKTGRAEARHD